MPEPHSRHSLLAFAVALALLSGACGVGGSSLNTDQPLPGADALGVIAYIDSSGCIARVQAASGKPVAAPFCSTSRKGATSVTWIDANSAAYVTAESRALGWQIVHFDSGKTETMDIADGPRVSLIPPQFYSSRGEKLDIDSDGRVSLVTTEGNVPIYPPANRSMDASTRLVAWSPDGEWVLLSTSTDKELWIVGRRGASPRQIARQSTGVASWFMPSVGATPHADLSCSVTTSQSFGCVTPLRTPLDGAVVVASPLEIIDFRWSACPGATGYQVDIFAAEAPSPSLTTVVAGTFLHLPVDSLPGGAIRWKVRALIGSVPAPWSEERAVVISSESP